MAPPCTSRTGAVALTIRTVSADRGPEGGGVERASDGSASVVPREASPRRRREPRRHRSPDDDDDFGDATTAADRRGDISSRRPRPLPLLLPLCCGERGTSTESRGAPIAVTAWSPRPSPPAVLRLAPPDDCERGDRGDSCDRGDRGDCGDGRDRGDAAAAAASADMAGSARPAERRDAGGAFAPPLREPTAWDDKGDTARLRLGDMPADTGEDIAAPPPSWPARRSAHVSAARWGRVSASVPTASGDSGGTTGRRRRGLATCAAASAVGGGDAGGVVTGDTGTVGDRCLVETEGRGETRTFMAPTTKGMGGGGSAGSKAAGPPREEEG